MRHWLRLLCLLGLAPWLSATTYDTACSEEVGVSYIAADACKGFYSFESGGNRGLDTCSTTAQSGADNLTEAVGSTISYETSGPPSGYPAGFTWANCAGVSSLLEAAADDNDFDGNIFTVAAWIESYSGIPLDNIVGKNTSSQGWRIGTNSSSVLRVTLDSGNTLTSQTLSTTPTAYFVVFAYDTNNQTKVFVNGVNVLNSVNSTSIGGSGKLTLCGDAAAHGFSGRLAQVLYRNDLLTDAQVCEMCRCGIRGDTTSDRSSACGSCTLPGGKTTCDQL